MSRFDAECWICDVQERIVAKSGSTPAGNTTTTQNSSPWSGQQPFLTGSATEGSAEDMPLSSYMTGSIPGVSSIPSGQTVAGAMPAAAALYENYTPSYYPGQVYAPLNGVQNQALSDTTQLASQGSPVTGAATGFNSGLLDGSYLNSNPSSSYFTSLANGTNSADTALESYANGSQVNSNPSTSALAQSVMAQVEPGIASQFIAGNDLNNPAAAYSVAQGVTSALAPTEYANYQQEQQNQLGAANSLGSTEAAGATGLSNPYQQTLQNMTQSLYASPSVEQMPYSDISDLYNAGTTQQTNTQNQDTAAEQEYNYNETLPYNQLNTYLGDIGGNYGGSSTLTSPYFENGTANTLGTVAGSLGVANGLSSLGSSSALSSLGALLAK